MGNLLNERFERLVMPLQKELYQFAISLTGQDANAEDLVQETFLSAYENFAELDDEAKVKKWLFAILKNHYLQLCRRRKIVPITAVSDLSDADKLAFANFEAPTSDPARIVTAKLDYEMLTKKLTPLERTTILMKDKFELKYNEIAEIVGCSIDQIKVLLYRARQKIAKFVKE